MIGVMNKSIYYIAVLTVYFKTHIGQISKKYLNIYKNVII